MIPRKQQQQATSNSGGTEGNGHVPTDRLVTGWQLDMEVVALLTSSSSIRISEQVGLRSLLKVENSLLLSRRDNRTSRFRSR
jgi:hypothetical protein